MRGVQASVSTVIAKNSLSGGIYGYGQHEHDVFGVVFNDGSNQNFSQPETINRRGGRGFCRRQLQARHVANAYRRVAAIVFGSGRGRRTLFIRGLAPPCLSLNLTGYCAGFMATFINRRRLPVFPVRCWNSPTATTPALFRCKGSGMRSINSGCRSRFVDGCWMPIL